MKTPLASLILIFLLHVIGCSTSNNTTPSAKPSQQNSESKTTPSQPSQTNTKQINGTTKIDHIVIVIEENHSHQEIAGNSSAPFINSLMKQGANFTEYYAIEHPSQPNYLDIFSGSNQGVTNDAFPIRKFSSDNLGSELMEKKFTFTGFSEGLPSVGYNGVTDETKSYARKHNPWVNFTNLPAQVNQPFSAFPTDYSQLPTVCFVIPNLKHDMHDGSIAEGDQWLRVHLDSYVKWAQTHKSLLIVTWDEDDQSQNNKVPLFITGPMIRNEVFSNKVNHFNLLRTIEDIYGLSHAGQSQKVDPIQNIWK
jgi:phosphatidylinositol-3-phosphatase